MDPADDEYCYIISDNFNDDCLLLIFYHLEFLDAARLASTCTRLKNLAIRYVSPKVHVEIQLGFSDDLIKMKELEKQFEEFGDLVGHLTIFGSYNFSNRHFEKLLSLCPYLLSLCLRNISFETKDADMLNNIGINLNKLKLLNCTGITDNWSEKFQRFKNLEHITLNGPQKHICNFFTHCTNLSSLAIDRKSGFELEDLGRIFKNNSQSIKQLKLIRFDVAYNFKAITTLIIDNLPKLEKLAIEEHFLRHAIKEHILSPEYAFGSLPLLKSLKIICYKQSVNSLLRRLSDIGTIEELHIKNGKYDAETGSIPLVFKQLQRFCWFSYQSRIDSLEIFKPLIKSQMPVITYFRFELGVQIKAVGALLKLIDSKKTLISMEIWSMNKEDRSELVKGIINLNRSNFNLDFIQYPALSVEEVRSALVHFVVISQISFNSFLDESAERESTR